MKLNVKLGLDVALWHIALFGCYAELVAIRGTADNDQAAPINLDL